MNDIEQFPVRELPIRLGQFLKLTEMVQDGFEAKVRIQYGEVKVNNAVETQRGRKLIAGDIITYQGRSTQVVMDEN